ncbi:unnamed protein product [Effrenium voratum]|nr:unnamed protein product [Effrenium voratum]
MASLSVPAAANRIRVSVASVGAALDGAVDALTVTPGEGPQAARVHRSVIGPPMSVDAFAARRSSAVSGATGLDSMASSKAEGFDWQLPSEAQAYERLPWTRSRWFNISVSSAIFLNTIWLGVETDWYQPADYEGQTDPWKIVNYCFVGFFCIELLIRIYSRTWWPFIVDNWNKFDTVLVLLSVFDTFILDQIGGSTGSFSSLRVLRVLRVARVLRLLRFFKPLWLLVIGAFDAMRALLWAWVLISILIYIFAILLTRTVGFAHKETPEIEQYFGNLLLSSFTLFQVMTLEGWGSVARLAMSVEPWVWGIIFVSFLLITTFSIMNMIVSVIVDSTLEAALDQKLQAMRDKEYQTTMAAVKVDEVFRRADGNGDGHITKEELMEALLKPDVRLYLREVGIDITNAEFIFDVIDHDGSGELEYKEFAMGLVKARGEAKAQDVLALQCDLWRRELNLREDLRQVCVKMDSRLKAVDEAVELLFKDLQALDSALK